MHKIGNLVYLRNLDLSRNQLTHLGAIGNLVHLNDLNLSHNQLTTLPDNFGDLVGLHSLYLYGNPLDYPSIAIRYSNVPNLILW